MHSAAGFTVASVERELRSVGSFVFGQQGRMHVHDAAGISVDHRLLENAHETCEHDDIHPRTLQMFEDFLLGCFAEFARVVTAIDELRRQTGFASDLEEVGVGLIAETDCDLGIERA